jgi:hypothetical protein
MICHGHTFGDTKSTNHAGVELATEIEDFHGIASSKTASISSRNGSPFRGIQSREYLPSFIHNAFGREIGFRLEIFEDLDSEFQGIFWNAKTHPILHPHVTQIQSHLRIDGVGGTRHV